MSQKNKSRSKNAKRLVPGDASQWPDAEFFSVAEELAEKFNLAFVLVANNTSFETFCRHQDKPWIGNSASSRIVIVWNAFPLDPAAILSWRCGMVEHVSVELKFITFPSQPQADWRTWLLDGLGNWTAPAAVKEPEGLKVGALVAYNQTSVLNKLTDYDPSFLTISPAGKMTAVLDQLDECKRMFREVIETGVKKRRDDVHKVLSEALVLSLREDEEVRREKIKDISIRLKVAIEKNFHLDRNQLPKVLLLGPSGSGKTLVARYLGWTTSPGTESGGATRPFKRVPAPEYLGRESGFEHDVFGYCAGAYTGAHPDGKKGFLLERIGGVVFFDEIGDASPAIQAKLLAYLDDYQVAPMGWSEDPLFCPMLIVAATNRPIDEWAEDETKDDHARLFRNDLFRRFNFVVRIPSLNERKGEELSYILDVMLQMEAFNPKRKIRQVGTHALSAFIDFDYDKGNFRELENLVRKACRSASEDDRSYLVKDDVVPFAEKGVD